jgi:hypothetical protein
MVQANLRVFPFRLVEAHRLWPGQILERGEDSQDVDEREGVDD